MSPLDALILGIVEGITEYLPISSTGHLILTAWLLGLDHPPEVKAAVDAFTIIVQGGAILAVLGLYRQRVIEMIRGLAGRSRAGRRMFFNLVIAFLPAAVLGPPLDDLIEQYLFRPIPVIAALAAGGVLLLGIRRWQQRVYGAQERSAQGEVAQESGAHETGARGSDTRRSGAETSAHGESSGAFTALDDLSWRQALIIGLLQCVAMWPGTSRSMMSIVGGMAVGLKPRDAAEFSFLLGLPTLGGACVYKLAKSFRAEGWGFVDTLGGWSPIVIGVVAATIAAALAIRWLVGYLSRHGMSLFGWYRLALAALLAGLIWTGHLSLEPDAGATTPETSTREGGRQAGIPASQPAR